MQGILQGWAPRLRISPSVDRQARTAGMFEACFQLLLVAYAAQPIAFSGCELEVDLHADCVQEQGHPSLEQGQSVSVRSSVTFQHSFATYRHAEAQVKSSTHSRTVPASRREVGVDSDVPLRGAICCVALWISRPRHLAPIQKGYLIACVSAVVILHKRDDGSRDGHDDADGDD